jgi:raffinose/stachyose/melibiose transport system permease protein
VKETTTANTAVKRKKISEKSLTYFLFTAPAVLLYTWLLVIPVSQGIYYSMTDWSGLSKNIRFIGLSNYISMFSDKRILHAFGFTFQYSLLLLVCVLSLATILALILHYVLKGRSKTFFRSIFFFPAVLSLIVVGMTWNEILFRVIPPIGEALGIDWLSVNILGNPSTAMYGILLIHIWQGTATPFVLILAGLQNIPSDLYEAAIIDGASPFQTFRKITIPFLLPTFNVAFVMVLKAGLMVFDYIRSTTGGGPARATESVAILIYDLSYQSLKMSYALAMSMVVLIIIIVITFLQMKASSKVEVGQL